MPTGRHCVPGFVFVLCLLAGPAIGHAYRPFISTDAAVADPTEIEIELGYFTLQREASTNTFLIPSVVCDKAGPSGGAGEV